MSFSSQVPSIIVADDDKSVRIVIGQALKKQGYLVHTTATAAGMWDTVNAKPDALLITDVGFPDGDALDMLPRLLERHPKLRVIVMSARADLLTAVQTQQQGAIDYLPKPFELSNLLNTTKSALNQTPQSTSHSPLIDTPQNVYAPLLGRSSIMQDVYKSLAKLSSQFAPILVEAEPGSMKSEVARALHDMGSDNAEPYHIFDCAKSLSEEHVNKLFSENGAFATAKSGTLFVNNVEMMSQEAQLRFINSLETQQHSQSWPKRLFVGSNNRFKFAVDNGDFREDLYFALSVTPVRLPALRERKQDIPAMAQHFCELANVEYDVKRQLSLSAISALQESNWPGNIRELNFIIKRLVMASEKHEIDASEVYQELANQNFIKDNTQSHSLSDAADRHIKSYFEALEDNEPPSGLYNRVIEEVERPLIERTLHLTRGNQIKAAKILGLNRNTLRKKIASLNISKNRDDYRDA